MFKDVRSFHCARGVVAAALVLVAIVSVAGCDDTVLDPFDGEERYFSVYGYIDDFQTTHRVRVVPVSRLSGVIRNPSDPQASIDATVTSVDLLTGAETRWRHSLEKLSDETYAHIYTGEFLVRAGRRYRLIVERSDGRRTIAETTVPRIVETFPARLGQVVVSADSSEISQNVIMEGVRAPYDITAVYFMESFFTTEVGQTNPVKYKINIPYGRGEGPTPDGGWWFTLDWVRDGAIVRDFLYRFNAQGTWDLPGQITSVSIRVRLLDENWGLANGELDPIVQSQPGAYSNVENGYGFWGSVGLLQQDFNLGPEFNWLVGL
ncbi:MAG: DUF4249 family protein [Rhodothermales bacterium]|nr:DUF4249 family protein [Rhodothermales bacterium]